MALATRQLARLTIAVLTKPNRFEHLTGAAVALSLGDALHLEAVLNIALHGHVWEQRVVLKHRVDVAVIRRKLGHVLAEQQHRASCGLLESSNHPQHRGLART